MTPTPPADSEWAFPNPATPLGSAAYYAIRFSAEPTREPGARLFAWFHLIEQMGANPQDPGVVRLKLDWWRQETARLDDGSATHPLTRDLRALGIGRAAVAPMQAVLDAAEAAVRAGQPPDPAHFHDGCNAAGGGLFELLGATEPGVRQDRECCRRWGGHWLAVERVRLAAAVPARLPPGFLTTRPDTPAVTGLLPAIEHGTDPRRLPIPEIARRLTATARALHHKLAAHGHPLSDKIIDRMPLAHLWTARRCR